MKKDDEARKSLTPDFQRSSTRLDGTGLGLGRPFYDRSSCQSQKLRTADVTPAGVAAEEPRGSVVWVFGGLEIWKCYKSKAKKPSL
jgi:hypothetical protein